MAEGKFRILNWNIGGSKFLELKSARQIAVRGSSRSREYFRRKLNDGIGSLLKDNGRGDSPDVVTFQEVVRYSRNGRPANMRDVIDVPKGYHYYPHWLIDTKRHSHQGKWNRVREKGGWSDKAFFAQGSSFLVKKDIPHFPIWSLPGPRVPEGDSRLVRYSQSQDPPIETVALESGLYLGDRNTEPRAALVLHVVLSELRGDKNEVIPLDKPLDIFVVNVHLTTLRMEREGVPDVDEEASLTRALQLDVILNGIVSRYNRWVSTHEIDPESSGGAETSDRERPIWIIAGDLNFTPESREYQTMLRRGFIDLISPREKSVRPVHRTGTKSKGVGHEPSVTLDYIFAGPKFDAIDPKVVEARTDRNTVRADILVSDHCPLVFDVPIRIEG